jgi:hypothetical protein
MAVDMQVFSTTREEKNTHEAVLWTRSDLLSCG